MKRIPHKRGERTFEPHAVVYLTGESNYSHLHLTTGEVVLSCRTLKWFADQWSTFLRLHKNTLINPDHIHDYVPADKATGTNYVVMSDEALLPVARRRVPEITGQLAHIKFLQS